MDSKNFEKNLSVWDEIAAPLKGSRLLASLQPGDREVALAEAQWEFIQRHDTEAYPHIGQAVEFAKTCIRHHLKREAVQIRRLYGRQDQNLARDPWSWTTRIIPTEMAIIPLEAIPAAAALEEDPRIAAIEEISPFASKVIRLYMEGYSREETAAALGVTPAQILYDLQTAAKKLNREYLQPSLFASQRQERRRMTRSGRPSKSATQEPITQLTIGF